MLSSNHFLVGTPYLYQEVTHPSTQEASSILINFHMKFIKSSFLFWPSSFNSYPRKEQQFPSTLPVLAVLELGSSPTKLPISLSKSIPSKLVLDKPSTSPSPKAGLPKPSIPFKASFYTTPLGLEITSRPILKHGPKGSSLSSGSTLPPFLVVDPRSLSPCLTFQHVTSRRSVHQ